MPLERTRKIRIFVPHMSTPTIIHRFLETIYIASFILSDSTAVA